MSPKTPVSVLVVIHSPGLRVLLLERASHPGFWQSVTGSLEAGETLQEAAMREVAEETGIECAASQLSDWRLSNRFEILPQWRQRYAEGVTHNVEHVFSLCTSEKDVTIAATEHIGWRWVPWRTAAAACFSWTNRDAILMLGLDADDSTPT